MPVRRSGSPIVSILTNEILFPPPPADLDPINPCTSEITTLARMLTKGSIVQYLAQQLTIW
jgi:hypothetical protein